MKDLWLRSIMGGILISLGCIVYLLCDIKIVGAGLFSIGLLSIIYLKQSLYTGSICKLDIKSNILNLECILVGNIFGCLIMALMIFQTKLYDELSLKATNIVNMKSNDSIISLFILGMLCELCIWIAVSAKEYQPIFIILAISIFVYCGFEHCIADMFYIFISKIKAFPVFIIPVLLGNTIMGMILQKYSKELN